MEKSQNKSQTVTRFCIDKPRRFNVIMLNDDVTTMDFVVMVLERVFRHTHEDAHTIMLKVHNEGCAIAGTYFHDIAVSKAQFAMALARENKFPLKLTIKEE